MSDTSALDVDDVRVRVAKRLTEFLAHQQAKITGFDHDLAPVVDAVSDLLAGGKRLRPVFAYWGWRAGGGPDSEELISAVTSLELLQACALIHDDVMDDSDTRRGRPSVHRRFAALHHDGGWRGSASAFGHGAAILLGDLCLAWTDELYFGSGLPDDMLLRAKPVLDDMRTELVAGQYLDLLEQASGSGSGSVDRALQIARYKAAKYTIERPLHLGATLAGADDTLLTRFSDYGLPLGEAFQLRDDILGVFGDPAETGKPAGDDLREGKRTALIAMTMEKASPAQRQVLEEHFGDRALTAEGVEQLREVIVDTGALEQVEQLITDLADRAFAAVGDVPAPASGVLRDLVAAATSRRT